MTRTAFAAALAAALLFQPITASAEGKPVSAPIVFFDIAGPDAAKLNRFYAEVFGWGIGPTGTFETTVTAPLGAAIRQDPAEHRLYIGVDDVTATLARITAAGGSVDVPRFEVKGVVILGLFKDPAGNPMGLVEMKDGKPKIP